MRIQIGNEPPREMTAEEVAEMEAMMAQMPQSETDPTETRMTEIEAALMELAAIMAGGE